jgi:predicted dehydrogenase
LPKEVRLGFVGAGGIAGFHLQNLKEVPEAKVVAFADPNLDAAKKRAQEVGLPVREGETVFADWQAMLERVEMEGVLILSPHAYHFEQILAALKRGLAVLCEKPMVITSEQARKVIAAAKEAGKPVVVSYQRRFQSAFRFIREQVRKGVLGEITFVEATIAQDWQQLTSGTWRQVPELSGGGMLMDSGSHMVDFVLWAMPSPPMKVMAVMNRCGTPVDINAVVSLQFEGEAIGVLVAMGNFTHFEERYTFVGTEGMMRLEQGQVVWEQWGKERKVVEATEMPLSSTPDRHFVDVVLGRAENESPPQDALKVVALTEAAYHAAATGQARTIVL